MSDIVERLREVPTIGHDAGCVIEAAGAIESLRQWKREAIEVLDEWDETWIAADKPGPLGKSKAQGVKELVESLRQRVAELEARCIQHAGEKEKLKSELAAIKGKQLTENNQTQFEQEHVPLKPASSEDRAIYDEIANNYFNGKQEPVALEVFKEWMVKELPPLTVIGDPEWWADRIYKYFIHPAPIPEGYVMVPIEPTPEMLAPLGRFASTKYERVLAAAPKPEE